MDNAISILDWIWQDRGELALLPDFHSSQTALTEPTTEVVEAKGETA